MPPKELQKAYYSCTILLLQIVSQGYLKTTEATLMEPHRKKTHNEKMCRAQDLSSYAQGQGHNRVRGQIVPKIMSQQ